MTTGPPQLKAPVLVSIFHTARHLSQASPHGQVGTNTGMERNNKYGKMTGIHFFSPQATNYRPRYRPARFPLPYMDGTSAAGFSARRETQAHSVWNLQKIISASRDLEKDPCIMLTGPVNILLLHLDSCRCVSSSVVVVQPYTSQPAPLPLLRTGLHRILNRSARDCVSSFCASGRGSESNGRELC